MEEGTVIAEVFEKLFLDGQLIVPSEVIPTQQHIRDAVASLLRLEQDYREHLPGRPPAPNPQAMEWSVRQFYSFSQLIAFRHLESSSATRLELDAPFTPDPENCYAVDLLFRFLPDLARMTRSMGRAPLQAALTKWGNDWPLSSVGMADLTPRSVEGFFSHPGLRNLYVDRIIETQDVSRLADAGAREAVRAALGLHQNLAPQLAGMLQDEFTG
ncbi:hypothetical protein [Planctomicrobium piriforme]|uniref:MoxR-vWA-beta-propeller ternary system domain-containing protein n=1 Tax=Planctomicrobium piriforme TaxID=1576369 RepID=A0A1I3E1J3_9PLAN|nr:hypothetical protein [Planctomicrobium piriforme]SFH92847.1 hypothetical protein SAMN05421753_10441 [Planctomicrobium piriforme]